MQDLRVVSGYTVRAMTRGKTGVFTHIAKPASLARASWNCRQTLGVGAAAAAVGWRVLGHCLVDFFAALGPCFGALLALLVQLVLGTEEFDEGLLRSIALLEAGAHDAQIAAGTIAVARGHGIEQAGNCFPGLQIGECQAAGMQIAALAQRDQLFYVDERPWPW